MITNPKDFFQQIQNLCEEVALKIKAISSSLSSYLTKADAEATYLDKTDAANTYLGKSETATRATVADSATSADKATNDANGNNISNTYLKSATASSTYLKQTDAQSKYLGKTAKAESAKTADTATSATSAGSATKATQDGDGNVISDTYLKSATAQSTYLKSATAQSTYLSKSDASSTYLGKTAKAESAKVADRATTADSATKATQDGNGKNIASTYATVVALDTTNTNVATAQTTANEAKTLAGAKVGISGNRGQLAGYETSGTATTINANSPDSNQVGTNVTVVNGSANTAWTKVVRLTAAVTVTLGSAWQWAGGEVPETSAGGVIVLCWCGDGGVANFVSVSA